jgi:polar amino acid transport system substrate-binding protein
MKKKHIIFWVIMILVSFIPNSLGAEQNILRINCTIHSPYEAFFFRLVEEICSRNSILIAHNTPPAGRSLINVNQGIDDGDGPRIEGLSSNYPNLVCVQEPFGSFMFGAFTRDDRIRIDGWSSLSGLNVAYIHGWKIFDKNVKSNLSVTRVKNAESLFKLLDAGRADAVLMTKLAGYTMIRKLGLENITFVEPPLALKPNFLYLNSRHAAIVPLLEKTLRELKSNGTYTKIYDEMLAGYGTN